MQQALFLPFWSRKVYILFYTETFCSLIMTVFIHINCMLCFFPLQMNIFRSKINFISPSLTLIFFFLIQFPQLLLQSHAVQKQARQPNIDAALCTHLMILFIHVGSVAFHALVIQVLA